MKRRFSKLLTVITVALMVCTFSSWSAASSGDIKWYRFDEGVTLGKEKDKKIFINFYADWCAYCKVMEKKTFKEPSVVAFINKNFIPIKVNSDKETKVASTFKVRGLPDSWFMSSSGDIIGHRAGFIPPETMINMLKYIHSDSYKTMSFKKFMEKE